MFWYVIFSWMYVLNVCVIRETRCRSYAGVTCIRRDFIHGHDPVHSKTFLLYLTFTARHYEK